jgi:membrane fusion protein, multidrug efflux system
MKPAIILGNIAGIIVMMALAFGFHHYFISNPVVPPSAPRQNTITEVESLSLVAQPYQTVIESRGVMRPRTQTVILPEVSGMILEISPSFREGGFFRAKDVLITIDDVDYQTELAQAEALQAQAFTLLEEEKARADQALDNWRRLGKTGDPGDLFLRKPQVMEAEKRLQSAQSAVALAKRNVERCRILAPYDGRILEKMADVGQVVRMGEELGRCYAIDKAEVRLPLSRSQLNFFDLPTENQSDGEDGPAVVVTARLGDKRQEWNGHITRVEGAMEEATQQLYVIATLPNPWTQTDATELRPKIGLFVDAQITGRKWDKTFIIPRKAVRTGDEVILIDKDNRIQRKSFTPLWSDRDHVIVAADGSAGLQEGDRLCVTPLAFPVNGIEVKAVPVAAKPNP